MILALKIVAFIVGWCALWGGLAVMILKADGMTWPEVWRYFRGR